MAEISKYPIDKESYYLLIMLYCANIDSEETEEEIKIIKSGHSAEKYKAVYELYEQLSDYELLQILIKYKNDFLLTPKDKENLMKVAKSISEADHHRDPIEVEVIHMLKLLLNNQN
jgi:hypothetical protein